MDHRLVGGITAVVAILTLPVGLLAGLFVGFEVAAVVFIVGWFLLTPLIPIVANEVWPAIRGRGSSSEGEAADADADDPLGELKARYARGEIGDAEFERRMERLVEIEDVEVSGSVERANREPSVERE
ncbi:SHOCT domain-containing protein [Halosimplex sp. J119]